MGSSSRSGSTGALCLMNAPPFVLRVCLIRAGVGGEAGSRGRASTNFGPEVWPSTSYQVCLPRPPGFFQESSSKAFAGFCGIFSSRERPDRASPLTIVHMFLSKVKRLSRDVVRSYRHLFARPAVKFQFMAEQRQQYAITLRGFALEVS